MSKREQITLRVLPETNEKLTRIAEKRVVPKGVIIDEMIKKAKESND